MLNARGSGLFGQLGLGHTDSKYTPTRVEGGALAAGPRLVGVSCGIFHALAVDEDGKLYAWGDGSSGQLGHGGTHDELEPVLVAAGDLAGRSVVAVSAASEHSACVTSDGAVFTWGISPPEHLSARATRAADRASWGADKAEAGLGMGSTRHAGSRPVLPLALN